MKFFTAASIIALSVAAALPTAAAAADKPVVGLVMKSLANDFFKNMLEGAEAHEKSAVTMSSRPSACRMKRILKAS
jgi:ribose transport system substrate-binding protein